MRRRQFEKALFLASIGLWLSGCGDSKGDPKAEAPPPAVVEHAEDANIFQGDHPEQFPLATTVEHPSASPLSVTGPVSPGVSRNLPAHSIAGRPGVEVK